MTWGSANSLGADTGCDAQLEVLGLRKELGGEVCGVEWRGDKHIGLRRVSDSLFGPIHHMPRPNVTEVWLTSAMFFWKTLFGPSLSSVTMNLGSINCTILRDGNRPPDSDPLVAFILEPVGHAELVLHRPE